MSTGASPAITSVVASLLDNLGTDFAKCMREHVLAGRWDQLETNVDPSSYPATHDGALRFRDDLQVVDLVRKRTFGGSTSSK